MTPHDAYSITIHVHTMTIPDIIHEQKELNTIIKLIGH